MLVNGLKMPATLLSCFFVYNVKKDKATKIPAVKHVDNTARVQTINRQQHPLYYDLLKEFKKTNRCTRSN